MLQQFGSRPLLGQVYGQSQMQMQAFGEQPSLSHGTKKLELDKLFSEMMEVL